LGEIMPEVDHPVDLSIEETRAFYQAAWSHVLGVINLKEISSTDGRTRSEGLGTGCACSWRGQRLILTAKHVLEDARPQDIEFLPRSGTAIRWDSPGKIDGVVRRISVGIQRVERCRWEHLAAIVLEPPGSGVLNVEFCDLPRRLAVDSTIDSNGSVLVIGFPSNQIFAASESKEQNRTITMMACPCDSFWGEPTGTPESALDSGYDPERHLLIRFQSGSEDWKPHGYSGAAVSCDPRNKAPIWTPNPLLLAIQTHAYPRLGIVRATRSSTIRRFFGGNIF
jgi:hypothetical protein